MPCNNLAEDGGGDTHEGAALADAQDAGRADGELVLRHRLEVRDAAADRPEGVDGRPGGGCRQLWRWVVDGRPKQGVDGHRGPAAGAEERQVPEFIEKGQLVGWLHKMQRFQKELFDQMQLKIRLLQQPRFTLQMQLKRVVRPDAVQDLAAEAAQMQAADAAQRDHAGRRQAADQIYAADQVREAQLGKMHELQEEKAKGRKRRRRKSKEVAKRSTDAAEGMTNSSKSSGVEDAKEGGPGVGDRRDAKHLGVPGTTWETIKVGSTRVCRCVPPGKPSTAGSTRVCRCVPPGKPICAYQPSLGSTTWGVPAKRLGNHSHLSNQVWANVPLGQMNKVTSRTTSGVPAEGHHFAWWQCTGPFEGLGLGSVHLSPRENSTPSRVRLR